MRSLFATLLFCAATAGAAIQNPQTTVILVRHAEKAAANAAMTSDVPLSEGGAARAKELARVLGAVHIDAIYTTQYLRTKQTVEPLAKALGIDAVAINAGTTYAADLAKTIREKHDGGTVVVVGHSNTTPEVIRALGVASVPSIDDSAYDDLFIVTLAPGAAPRLLTLHYGAASR